MGVDYKWRSGASFPVSTPVFVQRVNHLRAQSEEGRIDPAKIVDDARPKNAVLHPCFEWNDKVAAEKHRQNQARQMLRSVEVVRVDEHGRKTREIGYVSIATPFKKGSAYVPTEEALGEPDSRDIVLSTAWAVLKGFEKRWGRLTEFAEVVAAIERAEQSMPETAREAVA